MPILPDQRVGHISWSNNGRYLSAPMSNPDDLKIWDITSNQVTVQNSNLADPDWTWLHVWFSPDDRSLLGRGLAFPAGQRGPTPSVTAYAFDVQTGQVIKSFTVPGTGEGSIVRTLGWSPDGTKVAVATASIGQVAVPGVVAVWDFDTGKLLTTKECGTGINSLEWSPDSTRVAFNCYIYTDAASSWVKVLDVATYKITLTLTDPDPHAVAMVVSWSPDGTRLLTTGGSDELGTPSNPVIIWDAKSGERILDIRQHTGHVWWGSWSPDGKRIVTCSTDDTTRVWDATTGANLLTLDTMTDWAAGCSWSSQGDLLASGSSGIASGFSQPQSKLQVWQVWQTKDELIQYAESCCLWRELTADERTQFGLPEAE